MAPAAPLAPTGRLKNQPRSPYIYHEYNFPEIKTSMPASRRSFAILSQPSIRHYNSNDRM